MHSVVYLKYNILATNINSSTGWS